MTMASPALARAAADYRWLLDRGYPAAAALKLVGDRRQMAKDERMILFRGVASSARSASRAAILRTEAAGRELLVDGHNQALTVMHYLAGRPMFLGSDGLLRDAGGSHGRIARRELFERAAAILVVGLRAASPALVRFYLDAPIPGSAGHAELFRSLLAEAGLEAEVTLERSADAPLKAAPPGSLAATGDSAIADALCDRIGGDRIAGLGGGAAAGSGSAADLSSAAGVYDAARWAIELAFGEPSFLDLGLLLAEPSG
jgi:hypothetical protein